MSVVTGASLLQNLIDSTRGNVKHLGKPSFGKPRCAGHISSLNISRGSLYFHNWRAKATLRSTEKNLDRCGDNPETAVALTQRDLHNSSRFGFAERLVSTADKLSNARAMLFDYRILGEGLWQQLTGGREGTLWYYRALADAYKTQGRYASLR